LNSRIIWIGHTEDRMAWLRFPKRTSAPLVSSSEMIYNFFQIYFWIQILQLQAQQKKWSGHGRTGQTADYGLDTWIHKNFPIYSVPRCFLKVHSLKPFWYAQSYHGGRRFWTTSIWWSGTHKLPTNDQPITRAWHTSHQFRSLPFCAS